VELVSQVNLAGNTSIGADCKLYPFVSMGHPPQDFKHKGGAVSITIGERSIFRELVNVHPGIMLYWVVYAPYISIRELGHMPLLAVWQPLRQTLFRTDQ